jgi:hypothetical protein
MIIAFAPKHNRPGKKDATGAFQPEAIRFLLHYGEDEDRSLHIIDNSKSKTNMRQQVYDVLESYQGALLGCIAFFCHGYRTGLQFGIRIKDCDDLAERLYAASDDFISVPLYACDAARDADRDRQDDLAAFGGDGGFADELRDALCRAGAIYCNVDSHTTPGHTSRNPHVRRFVGDGSPIGGIGGNYIIHPRKREAWKVWRELLKTEYRYEYPMLTTAEIHEKIISV